MKTQFVLRRNFRAIPTNSCEENFKRLNEVEESKGANMKDKKRSKKEEYSPRREYEKFNSTFSIPVKVKR